MKRCKHSDFDVFISSWNATQNYRTPGIHFKIATWLQKCWERGETRLLLQAFRASGKSTPAGLFSAWLLCRDPDLRILVLSAESSLSETMVRTIRKIIERHPFTAHLRPDNPVNGRRTLSQSAVITSGEIHPFWPKVFTPISPVHAPT